MEKQAIQYGDRRIEFEVITQPIYSDRIRIVIDPLDGIRVFAPTDATPAQVRAAVRRRARWIDRHWQARGERQRRFISGEAVLYLGRRYALKLIAGRTVGVKLRGGLLEVQTPNRETEQIASALDGWYRIRAADYLEKRLESLYSPSLDGARAPSFRLKAMRRQWGSCSPAGILLLNPALIRAPRECIDYVLTHELCHLRHHNHSPAFKNLLRRRMPDWERRKSALEMYAGEVLS